MNTYPLVCITEQRAKNNVFAESRHRESEDLSHKISQSS